MATSTTPTKRPATGADEITSPSAKRALDVDFWAETRNKVAKVILYDLKELKIKDLTVTKRLEGKIILRCSTINDQPKVMKLACDDGFNYVTLTAFGDSGKKLCSKIHVNETFILADFEVRKENPQYRTGAYGDLEIILLDSSSVKTSVVEDFPLMPYAWKSVLDLKQLPDGTVVDVLAIVAINFGKTQTSQGTQKIDVSITDQSMATMRFTLWNSTADQLVDVEHRAVAISRACVSSYQGIKFLGSKWHTDIKIDPEIPEGKEILKWFKEKLQEYTQN